MTTKQKTAAEINARRMEIGAELAKNRFAPPRNARELEAEDERLKAEYVIALDRESVEARDNAEIKRRVEEARARKLADESEARISKAVADAVK